jgi:hypothetical protein
MARSEIASGNVGPQRSDVALDELGRTADLDAAEGWHRLEHEEGAPWIARQVAELDVAFGNETRSRALLRAHCGVRVQTGETFALPSLR